MGTAGLTLELNGRLPDLSGFLWRPNSLGLLRDPYVVPDAFVAMGAGVVATPRQSRVGRIVDFEKAPFYQGLDLKLAVKN